MVIVDESQHLGLSLLDAGEGTTLEQRADQKTEPDFHRIEPRTVRWCGMEDDLMGGITQTCGSARH